MQLALLLALSIFLTAFSFAYAEDTPSIEHKTLRLPPPAKTKPCPAAATLNLHSALKTKRAACMGAALRHMDINDRDAEGNTALHKAVAMNNLPVIKFLVKNGADIHFKDFLGYDARQIADNAGNRRLTDYFLELERETERLHEAVEANNIVAASSSLLRGASLGMRDLRLDTVLHRAAQSNFPDLGRLLIHHGARLEARNYLGETPLITAAMRDHYEFMKMLLEAGANVNAIDERRRTALDLVRGRADPRLMKLMAKSRARAGSPASVEFDWTESGPPVGPWAGDKP
jgi:ankyrin repeat protein